MPSFTRWIMSRLVAEIRRKLTLTERLAADRIDFAFLQRAQQLDLRVERQFADFVEKQRAAIGFLELADPLFVRAGKRTFFVAEQRALDQILRDRTTIDDDERRRLRARSHPAWRARSAPCRRPIRLR